MRRIHTKARSESAKVAYGARYIWHHPRQAEPVRGNIHQGFQALRSVRRENVENAIGNRIESYVECFVKSHFPLTQKNRTVVLLHAAHRISVPTHHLPIGILDRCLPKQ